MIREDYSYIHWVRKHDAENLEEVMEMVSIMYDSAGRGGGKAARNSQTEEMWSCTPGEVQLPDSDELYDRKADPFQLKNIIKEKPEEARELLQQAQGIHGHSAGHLMGRPGVDRRMTTDINRRRHRRPPRPTERRGDRPMEMS